MKIYDQLIKLETYWATPQCDSNNFCDFCKILLERLPVPGYPDFFKYMVMGLLCHVVIMLCVFDKEIWSIYPTSNVFVYTTVRK